MQIVEYPIAAEKQIAPMTELDKESIRQQLKNILSRPSFSHSKRYPAFLMFVVEHALEEKQDGLKERILGIEVFGRSPDYDTNADPIVRVTAVEIRKRLNAYYQDPAHINEIKICLPAGSYVPTFHLTASALPNTANTTGPEVAEEITASETKTPPQNPNWFTQLPTIPVYLTVAAILALFIFLVVMIPRKHESALSAFWSPVFASRSPVLICVADQENGKSIVLRDAKQPDIQMVLQDRPPTIAVDDTVPMLAVGEVIHQHQIAYRIKGQASTTLGDLEQGPDVLIGAFDNSWTLRLTQSLRYHFANNPGMTSLWIEDTKHPGRDIWVRHLTDVNPNQLYTDYALVARYVDPITNQLVVVAAGLGNAGTAAAGEFLASPESMEELSRRAPPNWQHMNIEVVLRTTVIGNNAGAPQIVAATFW